VFISLNTLTSLFSSGKSVFVYCKHKLHFLSHARARKSPFNSVNLTSFQPYVCTHVRTQLQWTYSPPPQSFQKTHKTRQNFPRRVRKIEKIRQVAMSARLSTWNKSAPTWQIFIKFDIWVFLEDLPRKFKFHQNLTRIMCTLHEDRSTFFNHISLTSSYSEKYFRKML